MDHHHPERVASVLMRAYERGLSTSETPRSTARYLREKRANVRHRDVSRTPLSWHGIANISAVLVPENLSRNAVLIAWWFCSVTVSIGKRSIDPGGV